VADFILFLGADISCLTCQKILKLDSNRVSYSRCYRGTFFNSQFHVHDALSAFTRYSSNIILGDVANSIPIVCTETYPH